MDSTAKILEQMDGTRFERTCGPVLRKMVPELANLIPSGINLYGNVIKSLSDGFCFIDDTHYAIVHITTNSSNLEKKWLYNGKARTTPKGDLIKAISQAREMHERQPQYNFTVFLVYNKVVAESLHVKVKETASDPYISVKIIEQRDIAFFLDHDVEGKYLRMTLLGIKTDRISRSLVMDIAAINLLSYAREISLQESSLTRTSVQQKAEKSLLESHKTINLLTGDSGFGKSTLCYGLIQSMLNNGRVALRVKPSSIEVSGSLEESIRAQLVADYNGLYVSDDDILMHFKNTLIVIDDINKSSKVSFLLEKIISWNQKKLDDSIFVLCPVWPQSLNRLENASQKKEMFNVISLQSLSFDDCKNIIEKGIGVNDINLTDQYKHALIFDSGFDPLLINLSLDVLKKENQYTAGISRVAIESYITDQLKQVDTTYQIQQLERALNLLGEKILRCRIPDPIFFEVEGWLGHDTEELRLINLIASNRKLFFFDDEGKMYFRHDRVRDQLFAMALRNLLPDLEENKQIFEDPYYAEIIGTALASSEIQKEIVEALVLINPLAVFYSLKFIQEDTSEFKKNVVQDAILLWRKTVPAEQIPQAIISNIAYILMGFDVKDIEIFTAEFPKTTELELARFRNGNWIAGVLFLSSINYFYPEAPFYWWFSILAHAKAKYRDIIIKEFGPDLTTRFTAQGIIHAYTFAGFLNENAILDSLLHSWDKFQSPANYPAYLWAVFNSSTEKDRDSIIGALSYWSTLNHNQKFTKLLYGRPIGVTVTEQIKRVPWKFSDQLFSLLLQAGKEENLREIVALLFDDIDDPRAIEIVLDVDMNEEVTTHLYDPATEKWDPANTHRRLSNETLNYLLQEFSNRDNKERRRALSWRYWSDNVTGDIEILLAGKLIKEDDPLFEDMIIWRAIRHDSSVLPLLADLIKEKPWLIKLLAPIWNDLSKSFFLNWLDTVLQTSHTEIIASALELLQRLDNEEACKILFDYWERAKFAKNAIETALFLSSPETRALADKEIKRLGFVEGEQMPEYFSRNMTGSFWSSNDGLSDEQKRNLLWLAEQLGRFSLHYGIKYVGEKERLTRTKMESLVPYVSLFDEHNIYHFAVACLKIGAQDLCYKYFYPLLHSHLRTRIKFTTEDLKKDLGHIYKQLSTMKEAPVSIWMDEPEKYGITSQMISEVVADFSVQYRDADGFSILTKILEQLGTRRDIILIENFFPDFNKESTYINRRRQNAVFAIKRRGLN